MVCIINTRDRQQTVPILVESNFSHALIFTEKGEKLFNIDYIQEMTKALVLHWLNEKNH